MSFLYTYQVPEDSSTMIAQEEFYQIAVLVAMQVASTLSTLSIQQAMIHLTRYFLQSRVMVNNIDKQRGWE